MGTIAVRAFTGGQAAWEISVTFLMIGICCAIPMFVLRAYGYRTRWRWSRAAAAMASVSAEESGLSHGHRDFT
jgi:hypothetical protein